MKKLYIIFIVMALMVSIFLYNKNQTIPSAGVEVEINDIDINAGGTKPK